MRRQLNYTPKIFLMSLVLILLSYFILENKKVTQGTGERIPVRISFTSPQEEQRIKTLNLKVTAKKEGAYVEALVTWSQLIQLKQQDFNVALIIEVEREKIDPAYHTFKEVEELLTQLANRYPDILLKTRIGESTQKGLPIWAIKISDNPREDEDEPAVLYTGVHHAREPLGAEICLYLIQQLCQNYGVSKEITNWVNEIEIWFVPVVNPDGYQLALDENQGLNWWRKNLRDNNTNGNFDFDFDGVDLNRNYDFNWAPGGDDNPSSWFYRGPYPFSEKEIQALRDLTLREKFVFGIGYHSFGESILFPWGNFTEPPDLNLIIELAETMASKIKRQSGKGTYSTLPLNGRVGQSSVWMYGAAGVIDFIVETGDEYFPSGEKIEKIAQENARAAFFLLDRVFGPGLTGHIYDANSGSPLVAQVEILELRSPVVKPRTSEPHYGRYFRILKPGRYAVEFSAPGYIPQVFENLIIDTKKQKVLDVFLQKKRVYVPLGNE